MTQTNKPSVLLCLLSNGPVLGTLTLRNLCDQSSRYDYKITWHLRAWASSRVDVLLYSTSAQLDQIDPRDENTLVQAALMRQVPIVIALDRCDGFSENELDTIEAKLREQLADRGFDGDSLPIVRVDTYKADEGDTYWLAQSNQLMDTIEQTLEYRPDVNMGPLLVTPGGIHFTDTKRWAPYWRLTEPNCQIGQIVRGSVKAGDTVEVFNPIDGQRGVRTQVKRVSLLYSEDGYNASFSSIDHGNTAQWVRIEFTTNKPTVDHYQDPYEINTMAYRVVAAPQSIFYSTLIQVRIEQIYSFEKHQLIQTTEVLPTTYLASSWTLFTAPGWQRPLPVILTLSTGVPNVLNVQCNLNQPQAGTLITLDPNEPVFIYGPLAIRAVITSIAGYKDRAV